MSTKTATAPANATSTEPTASRTKPRMGETPDSLWEAMKKASHGVVSREGGSRLLYPTLRVVAGDWFTLDARGALQLIDRQHGMGVREPTTAQADEFHQDLNADRVEVVLMSQPGYASNWGPQTVVEILHSPSGLSFTR
ncbi:hypothetical protein [Acidovorax sp. sic0104]|uniref:hypothetical protein n=1 Tax=Acidovorax sp. sic0104 TaxID=2854784 RepID=UPI001C48649B|nr:hypothetical protein [Acidovorax sp. sic0104]MBV7542016.1 hypothetical protein [Acidovorax sp. sic0104]